MGENGVFATMMKGTVILSSTIAPEQARELEAACPKDVCLVDAPISGGVTGAEQGKLVTMAAGNVEAYTRCSRVFEAYSKKVVYAGDSVGQGQMLKAVNQMLVGIHIVAAAEAVAFSKALEIDPKVLFETISECAGNSNMFQSRAPKMISGDYTARASLETLEKDMRICMELAEKVDVPCYLTKLCRTLYGNTPRTETVAEDACSVIRMYQTEK
jgi:3-hydroxyisobutyrate dehydrogenase